MATFLHLTKGRFLNFALTILASFFLVTTGWGQTVMTDFDDYYPGDILVITGYDWEPGEMVKLHIIEDSPGTKEYILYAEADSYGEIYNNEFLFNWDHLGVAFSLTATGLNSGYTDTVQFTDAPIVQILEISNQQPECVSNPVSVVYDVLVGRTNQGPNSSRTIDLSVLNLSSSLSAKFYSDGSFNTEIFSVSLDREENTEVKLRITGNAAGGTSQSFNVRASAGQNDNLQKNSGFTISDLNISSHPVNSTVTYDQDASFSVNASGEVSYQWEEYTTSWNPISNDGLYSGVTTSSLSLIKPEVSLSGTKYRVIIAGICGSITSNEAILTVNKKEITGEFTANDKVYDGNAIAEVLTQTLNGVLSGDDVSLTGGSAAFNDKTVDEDKVVIASGMVLSGADAANYSLTSVGTTTADITALAITGNFTANDKVYDGNAVAEVLTQTLNGVLSGDVVSLTGGSAAFNDKNVGTGKTVTLTGFGLIGADAGNYALTGVATTTANISALEMSGEFTADNKTYDGNTDADVLSRSLVGEVSTDDVSLEGGTASFDNKNVGTGKTVTLTGHGLTGADAANYTLTGVATTTADITALEISGEFTADNKTYDGNTGAGVLSRSLVGEVATDDVSLEGGTASFDNKNVGTGKTVTLSGFDLDGDDAGNYTLTVVATTTADITALEISGEFTADNKTYDGNTGADVLSRSLVGEVAGDDVSLDGGSAAFNDKNVGAGKTVTLTGATLAGADAANYTLTGVATTTANISTLEISGEFTVENKTYDGNTGADVLSRSLVGEVSTDDVSLDGGSATFDNKNVGTGKSVTLTGFGLTGADAANYTLTGVATTTANITARTLVLSDFVADSKTYDGDTSATSDSFDDNRVSGDDLTFSYDVVFEDKNVGAGKDVNFTSIAISGGTDANNYSLSSDKGTATADITARALVLNNFVADSKTYDGHTSVTGDGFDDDRVSGNDLEFTYDVAFEDKNVANAKNVNFTSIAISGGTDANNYSLSSDKGTAIADIIARALVLNNFVADSKTYDGDTSVTGDGFDDDRVSGNDLEFTYDVAFEDKNVATDKNVNFTSIAISGGTDANNYSLSTNSGTAIADIFARALVLNNFVANNKTYDGDTSVTGDGFDDNRVSGDDLTFSYDVVFEDKNVGAGKDVNFTSIAISGGTDANNYNLSSDKGTATANITARALTIITFNASKHEGQVNPSFSVTYDGFVTGENEEVLGGTLAFTTDADVNSCAGNYDILPSGSISDNYDISFEKGTLTVTGLTIDSSESSTPVALGSAATLKATVSPAVSGVAVSFYLDDIYEGTSLTNSSGTAALVVSSLAVNVYKVTAVIGDEDHNGCAESTAYLPVYDPNGGFVTGGGWINSPAGALVSDLSVIGKANFGFVSKYQKGSNKVDGNTEFQFKAGNLNFKSQMHNDGSLVIAGAKAIYKGVGTVNGTGNYGFMVSAIDGQVNGGGGTDKFRIKIWDKNNADALVYDNQIGADENAEATTVIGGGSIVIHETKGNNKTAETNEKPTLAVSEEALVVEILESMAVAPNPVRTEARVRFSLLEDAAVVLRLYDFNGREVDRLFSGNLKAGEQQEVLFQRKNLMSGVYILKLSTDRGNSYDRQIIIE